jgi:hypothetical protein
MQFAPVTTPYDGQGKTNGKMTIGGYASSALTGKITYVPFTTRAPAKYYMGVDVALFKYQPASGAAAIALTGSGPTRRSGIVDTGTTLLLMPSDIFNNYVSLLPGASVNSQGFLQVPNTVVPQMGNLTFTIGARDVGGRTLVLRWRAQARPTLYSRPRHSSSPLRMPPPLVSTVRSTALRHDEALTLPLTDPDYSYGIAASAGSVDSGDDFTLGGHASLAVRADV